MFVLWDVIVLLWQKDIRHQTLSNVPVSLLARSHHYKYCVKLSCMWSCVVLAAVPPRCHQRTGGISNIFCLSISPPDSTPTFYFITSQFTPSIECHSCNGELCLIVTAQGLVDIVILYYVLIVLSIISCLSCKIFSLFGQFTCCFIITTDSALYFPRSQLTG